MIDGESWGSRTLEPGTYILSCGGGGVMGLESATVCIEYPVVTGTTPGRGWLITECGGNQFRNRLVVTPATQPPAFKKSGEVTIEGKVTYRGNPVPGARISFVHESGGSFVDDGWKTKADGSFRIVTKKLWAGKYRIRVFKQGTSFGNTM